MANTMLTRSSFGNKGLISQIKQFASNLRRSGQNPEEILNELVRSGKVTKEQLENAKNLANLFVNGLKK
jgi:malonyl CoA-acyl carrier protein transacylase